MCNPSTSPAKASTSASTSTSSSSSSSSNGPNRMPRSAVSSPASRDTRPNNSSSSSRFTNQSSSSENPILKLVTSLRNSEPRIQSPPRQLARREESRDDHQYSFHNGMQLSVPVPVPVPSFQQQQQQQEEEEEEEEEDEIPRLIDEIDHHPYSINTTNNRNEDDGYSSWHGHSTNSQQNEYKQQQQHQQQQQQSKLDMPFFVLDWMLEDLVPDHQNAQDLANLLHQQESKTKTFAKIRKTKSCGNTVATATASSTMKTSPIIHRLLPWSSNRNSPDDNDQKQHDLQQSPQPDRPCTPTNLDENSLLSMPLTPKSSNRKNSKIRQTKNRDMDDMPMVPRNLCDAFSQDEPCRSSIHTNDNDNDNKQALHLSNLMPRVDSSQALPTASPCKACEQNQQSWTSPSTKKSASCPQLYQDDPKDNDHLRQRAKEQQDRRERRNKQTVVQRSLTLAQGWNNRGLVMAGNATRAIQQQDSQQQQQQQQWWESALECWDNALEIYRSLLGEYHERVADVQNNRGIALGKLGRCDEALAALRQALTARKRQTSNNNNNNNNNNNTTSIVSTLHNIANVFRDAGNPAEALRVLREAQEIRTNSNNNDNEGWHQSARLSTAIGHVYYESFQWKSARSAYGEALEAYDKLRRSLAKELHHLQQLQDPATNTERMELLHQQQLIQREVSILQKDLDELDRSQQAQDGSRAQFLHARQLQQQQQQQQREQQQQLYRRQGEPHRSHQQPQQHNPKQPPTLFGIVSSLRA